MGKMNVRVLAHDLLIRIEKSGSFSHLLISQAIENKKVAEKDENLLTEIIYGTVERQITLDYYIAPFIANRKKIDDWVRILLRMSVYQLIYLDKVPSYAIINEAVDIAKTKGHRGIGSFVNGVLRSIERKGVPSLDDVNNPLEKIALETSHPLWLVKRWNEDYGFDMTQAMCERNITTKPLSLRVNRLKASREEVMHLLNEQGVKTSPSEVSKYGIIIREGNIFKTNLIRDGFVTVQDQSSILAGELLDVQPDMSVIDACSAPGGKATLIGEAMDNQGIVFAYDLHKNKQRLIDNNATRLGLTNITSRCHDARKLQEIHDKHSFDRILVDAPCTGLGIIRSKPDVKYNKQQADIDNLHHIQFNILQHVADLLKSSGKLVYSTCTVVRKENDDVIRRFLEENPNFIVDPTFFEEIDSLHLNNVYVSEYGLQIFPHSINSDGFFMTRLIQKS